ncbi:MAG: preprotein translocase subunit SecG [Gammaproteobacteria bacterium]|nr:preprotein translocase subunit SecG [Gammaproteobacteria bacterium]
MMHTALLVFHTLLAISLIVMVLIQHGKGADMGASFGAGASQTVFGSQGAGSFLTRVTAIMGATFFITSLTLAYFSHQGMKQSSVTDSLNIEAPAAIIDKPDLGMNVESLPGSGDVPAIAEEK